MYCIYPPLCLMAACLNQSVKQNFIKSQTGDLFMVPSEALDRLQYEQKKKPAGAFLTQALAAHHPPNRSNTRTGFRLSSELLTKSCKSKSPFFSFFFTYGTSSNKGVLSIPSSHRRTVGDTASSVAAPPLQTSLPVEIHHSRLF